MPGYRPKHYGLTGQEIRVRERRKYKYDGQEVEWQCWRYPFEDLEVPLLVTGEYPKFLCCTVLPHANKRGIGKSRPYPITINKFDIYSGEVLINGGAIR